MGYTPRSLYILVGCYFFNSTGRVRIGCLVPGVPYADVRGNSPLAPWPRVARRMECRNVRKRAPLARSG